MLREVGSDRILQLNVITDSLICGFECVYDLAVLTLTGRYDILMAKSTGADPW